MEKKINSIASYLFIGIAFLIPLIFSASPLVTLPFSKVIPFFLVTFAAAFLFIILIFNEGKVSMPRHWIFIAAAVVPVAYLVSSFTSIHPGASFLGTGADIGTASTIIGLFLFMYLVSTFMRSKDKVFISYLAFIAAFGLLAFFHILRFAFGADFLSFGVFGSVISNTLGRFTDLGIVAGIAVLLSLTSIEFLRLGKLVRVISYVMLGASLVVLTAANFPLFIFGSDPSNSVSLLTLIGVFALVFFVYFVASSYESKEKGRRIPVASLIVLVVSIVFTLGGAPLQNALSSAFKIEPTIETRLLWTPTANLSVSTLTQLPVRTFFGYGPEQFWYKWMLEKPVDINNSNAWNTAFGNGVGFIPSTIVTTGIIGFLGWIAFLGIFLWLGAKSLFMKNKDPFSHYILVSSFLVSVYLWIAAIVYVPSLSTFILTFFFSGIFLASLFREKVIAEVEKVFDDSKSKSFVYILGLIFMLIVLLFWAYKIGERAVAASYVGKANVALMTAQSNDDVNAAKEYLRKAGALSNEALYSRALASVALSQVNNITQDTTTSEEQLRAQFEATYREAISYSQNAVVLDPDSFDNFVTYGNVLAAAVPLRLEGYYEPAKAAYGEAAKLNPNSPLIPYLLARLAADNGDFEEAKKQIGEAIRLKQNYVDAIVLLGRIQVGEGKTDEALNSFAVAQSIEPQNQDIQAIINALRERDIAPTPSAATSTKSTN